MRSERTDWGFAPDVFSGSIMSNQNKEVLYIRIVTLICLFFGLLGVILARLSGSVSMLFDGLYSLIQSIFIFLSSFIVRIIEKKDDENYQFGYASFEPFYILLRTLLLVVMDIVIFTSAVKNIVAGGYQIKVSLALVFTAISIVGCFFVYLFLKREGNVLSSPLLRTEAKSWLNDLLISLAVLVSFSLMAVLNHFGLHSISLYIDPLLTILFVMAMLPSILRELFRALSDMLDKAPPLEITDELDGIVSSFVEKYSFSDYFIYSAKRGRTITLTVHIVLARDMRVSFLDAVRKEMMMCIKNSFRWSDIDIVFTIDPSWMKYSVPLPDETQII